MSVFFDGKMLTTPVTASAVNDDAMLNQNLSVGNVVAFVGEAQGGKHLEILRFGNPNEARSVLVGGDLCDAVVAAFSPSSETGAAQTVKAVRINQGIETELQLPLSNGTNGTTASSYVLGTLRGKSYSKNDATIKVKVDFAVPNSRDITVSGGTGSEAWTLVGNDVSYTGIAIHFKAPLCSFTVTGNNTVVLVTDVGTTDEQTTTLDLDLYPTFQLLDDYIQTLRNAAGVAPFAIEYEKYADVNAPSMTTQAMDQAIYQSGASDHDKQLRFSMHGYLTKKWFDDNLGDVVDFELNKTDAAYWHYGLFANDFKFLSAKPAKPTDWSDWEKGLNLLADDRDIQWVHGVSGKKYIHTAILDHVTTCSLQYKERRAILGTEAGTSDDEAIALAKAINSPRVSLVHIGHYAYNNGKLALRPPYMTAGLVAAAFAGMNPGTPLTNKSLQVQGLERNISNPTDTDKLLKGGVMPIENTDSGYKVTQSISTWLGDTKYNNREQSCGVAVDFTIRNVRQALDVLRGSKQSPILLARAISITKGALTELARPEPQGPMVLVGDENTPAWRNVTATVEGDVLRVQFEASPVIPNNYILVTMYAVPYSGSATA